MKAINVNMNEVDISTEEQPIIGTEALGPCVGILIYSKTKKKAIVGHLTPEWKRLIPEIFIILGENGLISIDQCIKCIDIFGLYEKITLYDASKSFKKSMILGNNLTIDANPEEALEITIIPGYYPDGYNIITDLLSLFSSYKPLMKVNTDIPKKAIKTIPTNDMSSHNFYFNANTGKYVTDKILAKPDIQEYRLQ